MDQEESVKNEWVGEGRGPCRGTARPQPRLPAPRPHSLLTNAWAVQGTNPALASSSPPWQMVWNPYIRAPDWLKATADFLALLQSDQSPLIVPGQLLLRGRGTWSATQHIASTRDYGRGSLA
mmetsp:Transcript_534/g.1232  ORF Transcript_534/g.1232 Transcript_534/m.1232 type:complete len:122 (-) Transcript_534:114-479(-)